MTFRRTSVLLISLLTACGLATLLWQVLAPGGWTPAKLVMLAAFAGTAPWTGLCLANGLIGFVILTASRDPIRAVFPVIADHHPALPRTAIAMTVRDEDMRRVLPPLRRLLHELDLAGAGDAFAVFILSDTQDVRAAAAERQAVAAFRAEDRDPTRIHYRRRAANTGFKAGNIMDFLDHHAEGFELMLTLDADSAMSAAAVLRLVRAMQADPTLAIVQHLTVGLPASSAFPRLFQFGMRAGMRTWATGQAWWQGDEGPYWGHNAVVRIAPFRAHCRLPILPDGRPHPVARSGRGGGAARRRLGRARAAGRGRLVRGESAGAAGIPPPRTALAGGQPAIPAPAASARTAADGALAVVQAILLFAGAPLYLLFLLAAAAAAATDGTSPFPARAGAGADRGAGSARSTRRNCWATPRWRCRPASGTLRRAGAPHRRGRGGNRLHAAAGCRLDGGEDRRHAASGVRRALGWRPQNRDDRGVSWGEATRLLWPQTALGVLVFAGFADRRVDGDTVGAAACRRPAGGDPALRADRRSARRSLAEQAADRGDTGGTRPTPCAQVVRGLALRPQPEA